MTSVYGLKSEEYVIPFQATINEKKIKRVGKKLADTYLKCLVSRDNRPAVFVVWYCGEEWKNFLVEVRGYSM